MNKRNSDYDRNRKPENSILKPNQSKYSKNDMWPFTGGNVQSNTEFNAQSHKNLNSIPSEHNFSSYFPSQDKLPQIRNSIQLNIPSELGNYVIERDKPIQKGIKSNLYKGYLKSDKKVKIMIKHIFAEFFGNLKEWRVAYIQIKKHARELKFVEGKHLLKVHDILFLNNDVYIFQEYKDGITLDQYLHDNGGQLQLNESLQIFKQIATGINELHNQDVQVYHQHLKPSNIWLGKDRKHIKIELAVDKVMAESLIYNIPYGLQYRSPNRLIELLKNQSLNWNMKCDSWSLGVILYEMLEGKLPFVGLTHSLFYGTFQPADAEMFNIQFSQKNLEKFNSNYSQLQMSSLVKNYSQGQIMAFGQDQKCLQQIHQYLQNILLTQNQISFTKEIPQEIQKINQKLLTFVESNRMGIGQLIRLSTIKQIKQNKDIFEEQRLEELRKEEQKKQEMIEFQKRQEELEQRQKNRFWD